ncbi:hypothetical protein EDD86DRAFT_186667 [Gorgonomyces haynaldii]|nr:hypothetical protein EDD86DRAFT_186667 [Gorgonomyces haynaldii]
MTNAPNTSQLEQDLQELLKDLTNVIQTMEMKATHQQFHLLSRHKANLFEYNKEFQKTKQNIKSAREHQELLGSIQNDIKSFRNQQDYYHSERSRMDNTHARADELLQLAMDTNEDLEGQGVHLFSTQSRMTGISSRFPLIGNVLHQIQSKKNRDTLILGSVIGVLTVLLLWYALY